VLATGNMSSLLLPVYLNEVVLLQKPLSFGIVNLSGSNDRNLSASKLNLSKSSIILQRKQQKKATAIWYIQLYEKITFIMVFYRFYYIWTEKSKHVDRSDHQTQRTLGKITDRQRYGETFQ
jgi:preprotein translocase subunit SecG